MVRREQFEEVYKMAEAYAYPDDPHFREEALANLGAIRRLKNITKATKAQAAYVLNYHCRLPDGSFDMWHLELMRWLYKRYVRLID